MKKLYKNNLNNVKSFLLKTCNLIIKNEFLLAFLVGFIIISVGVFLGWENNKVVPTNPDTKAHYTKELDNHLSFLSNWDGPIYLRIANQGYRSVNDTAFFPLYPTIINLLTKVVKQPLYEALVASWVSLIGAIYFYIKIFKKLYKSIDNIEALRGVYYFLLFPASVVLIATYTESLFAFLSLGAIYFVLKKRYLTSALFAMFATATHINGVFVLALVIMIALEQRAKITSIVKTAVIGSLGLLSYMIYLFYRFSDPFEFINGQKTNGWLHSDYIHRLINSFNVFDVGFLVLLVLTILYWWGRKKSFAIYSFLYLCIPLIGGQFTGFGRYIIMVFPLHLMLYDRIRNNKFAYSLSIALFAIFWSYFLLQFSGGYTGI